MSVIHYDSRLSRVTVPSVATTIEAECLNTKQACSIEAMRKGEEFEACQ